MKLKETEGTPIVKTEEQWQESFRQQRADRLQDAVDEYMQDGEVVRFYEDLTKAIQSLIDYHDQQKEYAKTAMKAIGGHRPLQLQQENDKYLQRKYNLAEADYYDKRAQLDMEHSKYYWDKDRNKPDVKADGYSHKDIPNRY